MAIIGYDPEKEEVPNEDKIKNCFSLAIIMLVGMPLIGVIYYVLKNWIISKGYISEIGSEKLFKGYTIIAIFLTVSIILTLGYLRRRLKKEKEEENQEEE